jgi:glutathione S-transferase
MILIGQYDSPFVRRVGIAMTLYGLGFEHRPLSVFGDAEAVRTLNPLMRVPALVLDDGFVLTDSHMILDYIDSLVPEGDAMFPRKEPDRHRALKVAALATGLADKAVSLFYERAMHDVTSTTWEKRCRAQITSGLAALEADRATQPGPWWFGPRIGHADIAAACALRFSGDAHPGLINPKSTPALAAHAAACEAMPVFQQISQPFVRPA